MIYLLSFGSYSDYSVYGIVEGRDGLTADDLKAAHEDHGARYQAWLEVKWATIGPPQWRRPEWRAIAEQYELDNPSPGFSEVFAERTGSRVLRYEELWNDQ
jgi:hypothetical protein